jgi:hypothetical protein
MSNDKYVTIDFATMDFKKLTFSEVKTNKYGANYVNIQYDGKIPLCKFPKMQVPFGISAFEDQKNPGVYNYCMETSFDNLNESSPLQPLYKKALEFDDVIVKAVAKHHKEWLNDDEKPDAKYLKKQYTPFVKVPTDKKTKKPLAYASRCKASFYVNKTGEFSFSSYDASRNKLTLTKDNFTEHIGNRDEVMTARQMKQIWFTNMGGFGVSWELQQARIFRNSTSNECLLSDDEDEDEVSEKEDTILSDEEEEDSSDEEEV